MGICIATNAPQVCQVSCSSIYITWALDSCKGDVGYRRAQRWLISILFSSELVLWIESCYSSHTKGTSSSSSSTLGLVRRVRIQEQKAPRWLSPQTIAIGVTVTNLWTKISACTLCWCSSQKYAPQNLRTRCECLCMPPKVQLWMALSTKRQTRIAAVLLLASQSKVSQDIKYFDTWITFFKVPQNVEHWCLERKRLSCDMELQAPRFGRSN